MKKLSFVLLCVLCFFALGVYAQDYPEVSQDDEEFVLSIPYFEFDDAEGETKAYAAELFAPKDGGELRFYVDEEALVEVALDAPAEIEGEGACSMATDAQSNACEADVKQSYFNQMAVCFNYGDEETREECLADATDERIEGLEECDEIEEAHADLCGIFGEAAYDPELNPENFLSLSEIVANPNPWLPLVPGNTWLYEGEDETITVMVLNETREIMGIDAVVVRDFAEEDGELVEDTYDWFAQDNEGNVWYMGELSREYEDGELAGIEGSWEAGVDGAKPGILFRTMPVVGEIYRQEYLVGEAEDVGKTLGLGQNESTEAGYECDNDCLVTEEWTPLEPDGRELKYYLPGTGQILAIDLEDDAREELVEFISGN